jgi:tetratricopeptide (TPR) repeat protein
MNPPNFRAGKEVFSMATSRYLVSLLLALFILMPHMALALTGSQVYERVKDSVVVVMATDRAGKPAGQGSGVVLPSGYIVTNYHVVKAATRLAVGQRGRAVPASLQASNPNKDLALLLAPGLTATPARLGQASLLKVGEPVYAVGAPEGLELSLSEGIVSQLRGGPPPIIQTTVAISPGSSGGGLFNAQGELVGITTFYLREGQSLNFALPVEWIRTGAPSPMTGGGGGVGKGPVVPVPGTRVERVWYDRAVTLERARDWQGLLAHCRQWTKAEPGNYRAWCYLGLAYSNLRHPSEALRAFREGLRLKPDSFRALHDIGVAYLNLGRYQEAIKAFRESLSLKPDYADAWQSLAKAYALSGNRAAALEAVNELRRYDPQKADKLYHTIIKP